MFEGQPEIAGIDRQVAVGPVLVQLLFLADDARQRPSRQRAQGRRVELVGARRACQLYDAGNQARTLTVAGYIGGGALLATSAIIYLTRPNDASGNGARVACAIAPVRAGIECALRF